jgi:hypothetical protein
MKKLLYVSTVLLILSFSKGQAQNIFQKTFDGDSSISITVGMDVKQTSDGGYILVGLTNSYGAGDRDIYVIKLNSVGDTIWTRTFGNSTIDDGYSIIQTPDNCYVITGVITDQNNNYKSDAFLLKIDQDGNIKWMKTYDSGKATAFASSILQTHDGGFLLSGGTSDSIYFAYIIKTDSVGNPEWNKIFNSSYTNAESLAASSFEDDFGNYYITGKTNSPPSGNNDIFVIKFSSSGNTIWSKTYGAVWSSDNGLSICKTYDGNFVIIGYTVGCEPGIDGAYLLKINSLGDTLWTKCYASGNPTKAVLSNNNGLIITGRGLGVFLFKIDSLGYPTWFKTYGIAPYSNPYFGNSVAICSDAGYIVIGETSVGGKESMYLIKTDKDGNSGCNETSQNVTSFSINTMVTDISFNISSNVITHNVSLLSSSGSHVNTLCTNAIIEEQINNHFYNITISPNPFSFVTTVQINEDLKDATLIVYNSFGQEIKIIKNIMGRTIILHNDNLQSGLYFMQLTQENKIIATEKLVITD